jgi:tetratricopeptide (TPR) repeat protein
LADQSAPSPAPERPSQTERLESWKEIATYLKRDVRTVQRWERREALPVHRHRHDRRASIYAYRSELERWLRQRLPDASGIIDSTAEPKPRSASVDRRGFTVGRDRERAALRASYYSAQSGHLRLVSVTGEPGIGKTTLVESFLRELTSESGSCTVVKGRCSERLASAEAYAPIFEGVDSLLRGPGGRLAARVMRRVAPTWYRILVPGSPARGSSDEPTDVNRLRSAETMHFEFATFVKRLSRKRPFVLFLDDVHWADPPSVELVGYLTARIESNLFVITAYRPADLALSKSLFTNLKLELAARGTSDDIRLEFLSVKDVETYLTLEFPNHRFPSAFASLVQRQTGGNPLFVVELLNDLRVRRALIHENNQWVLVADIPDLRRELPTSVRSVIERHLAQLSESDRHLLTVASVQGDQFDSAVVAGALQREPADVEERLEVLDKRHGLVRMLGDGRLPGGAFTQRGVFVHILYQNALYELLQPTRKAEVSAAIARELLEHHGDHIAPIAAQLGLLFETARDPARAAEYFRVAAERAAQVFAYAEAVALAARGLRLLSEVPDSAARANEQLRLHLVLGLSLSATKGFGVPEIAEHYAPALALCDRLGDLAQRSAALSGLSAYHTIRGELSTAQGLALDALRLAQEARDDTLVVQAHYSLGQVFANAGVATASLEHVHSGLALYDPADHQLYVSRCRRDPGVLMMALEGWPQWTLGYPDRAVRSGDPAVALARRLSHPLALAEVLAIVALVDLLRRDTDRLNIHTGELLELSIERGIAQTWLWAKALRGWAVGELGDPIQGLAELRECLGSPTMAISELMRPLFLVLSAALSVKAEDPQQGLAAVAEAQTLSAAMGQRFMEPECHRLDGECRLIAGGSVEQADLSFERAIHSARELGARSFELRALVSRARLNLPAQQRIESRTALADLYNSFTEGFETPDMREANALLSDLSS